MESSGTRVLTISTCLLQPFYKLLANYDLAARDELARLRALGPSARLPLEEAHARLSRAVELTGDPDLGLKAGRLSDLEDGGVVAYAAGSAPTLREAIITGTRYMRLLNDAMDFRLIIEGARAVVRLDSKVPLPRASADFQASAVRTHHRRTNTAEVPDLEWWFVHERPSRMEEYERTFGKTVLRFSMPYFGFTLDARFLDVPLATADPRQHEILLTQMEAALAGVPRTSAVADRVRELVMRYLATGQLSINVVARDLRTSRRTLARRLGDEGTSFTELLDDTRRRMALYYLENTDRPISQIAFLLGFSEVSTFYRAFKRWTEVTPVSFRDKRRLAIAESSEST